MRRLIGIGSVLVFLSGCGTKPQAESFDKLAEEFVYTSLANSPVAATQVGYHSHKGVALDSRLDDYSAPSVEQQRRWYQDFRIRLVSSVDAEKLNPEDRADYDILQDQISLALLEIDTIQSYKHNPTLYVELIGNALYSPFVLQYTDKTTRFRQIIARMLKIPLLVEQAERQLVSAPEIWNTVAQGENEGNIGLIDQEMRAAVPAELKEEYETAANGALKALHQLNDFLKNGLSRRGYAWQLGSDKYAQKFRFVLATDQTPRQVLAGAESELKRVRDQMYDLALPMYQKLHPDSKGKPEMNEVISAALGQIAEKHA
ncbi:MAG: DUF885 family protein, partial [Bryobacteraceae bacterium]